MAPGNATQRSRSGEALNTVNARGMTQTAVRARRSSPPSEVAISTSTRTRMTSGSASHVRVRKKTSTSAALFLTRSSKSPTPRRNHRTAAARAGIQARPRSHQCPGSSTEPRTSLTTAMNDIDPLIAKWAFTSRAGGRLHPSTRNGSR